MNEKKTILSAVFGISLVSYIVALFSVAIQGITMLDFDNLIGSYGTKILDYIGTAGALLIVALVIGIAYALVFAFNKKNRQIVNIVCACVMTLYFIITAISLKNTLHDDGRGYYPAEYTMFTAYLTAVGTLIVTMLVATVSWLLLARLSGKTNAAAGDCSQSGNTAAQAEIPKDSIGIQ